MMTLNNMILLYVIKWDVRPGKKMSSSLSKWALKNKWNTKYFDPWIMVLVHCFTCDTQLYPKVHYDIKLNDWHQLNEMKSIMMNNVEISWYEICRKNGIFLEIYLKPWKLKSSWICFKNNGVRAMIQYHFHSKIFCFTFVSDIIDCIKLCL